MELLITITLGCFLFYIYYRLLFIANRAVEYRRFKKQYVVPFDHFTTASKRDPLTGEPFKDGELIVKKCKTVTSLSTWNYCGRQCPSYPRCLDYPIPCNGAGAPQKDKKYGIALICLYAYLSWIPLVLLNFYIYPKVSTINIVVFSPFFILLLSSVYSSLHFKISIRLPERKFITRPHDSEKTSSNLTESHDGEEEDILEREISAPLNEESNQDIINIVIRIEPGGNEYTVELSNSSLGLSIIKELIYEKIIPKADPDGNEYIYALYSRSLNVSLTNVSLKEAGIENGDLLYLAPKLAAGGKGDGMMIYNIPEVMAVGKKNRCTVRISGSELKKQLLRKGLISEGKITKVEVSKLMSVSLYEYALYESLVIKSASDKEQLVTEQYYTEWIFDVIPNKKGFTSLLLKVSILEFIESVGQKGKNVFTIDLNIELTNTESEDANLTKWVYDIEEFSGWTSYTKQTIIQYISSNETGKALSTLANYAQGEDADLYSSIILLQAQYNEGRNKSMLNLIEQTQWWMLQSRINFAVLELVKDIDEENFSVRNNLEKIQAAQSYLKEYVG